MTPWKHAESSASKFGGKPEDYIEIHDWFDETKMYTGNWTHRVLRHHSAGVQWAVEKFGHVIKNSSNQFVPVKLIAERHVQEDCGFIPTPQDYLKHISVSDSAKWMLSVPTKSTSKLEIQ